MFRQFVRLTVEEFPAFPEASKQGKQPVLRYPIPDPPPQSYAFEHLRTNPKGRVVYRCTGCRKRGKTISIAMVVNGNKLVGNPVDLPICLPWVNAKERINRMFYKDMAREAFPCDVADEAERAALLSYFDDGNGFQHRRCALRRATAKLHDARVTMGDVPREYAYMADGSLFLHLRTEELHIYCSTWNVEKACQLGMFALVADGVHDFQREATNKTGQLYIIHGVLANSMDIPLLFAITKRKNARTYEVIYGKMKELISNAGGRLDLRIVLDFEEAAINAAKGMRVSFGPGVE